MFNHYYLWYMYQKNKGESIYYLFSNNFLTISLQTIGHDGIFLALISSGHYICWKGNAEGFMMKDIDEILKPSIEKQLAPATIVDLYSEEAEDVDGDPILQINVV